MSCYKPKRVEDNLSKNKDSPELLRLINNCDLYNYNENKTFREQFLIGANVF